MAEKIKIQPISRVGLEPLVAMAESLRDSIVGWQGSGGNTGASDQPSDLARDLAHLAKHDTDGFVTISQGDEVVGFLPAHVRSRQLILPQPWLLPECWDQGLGENLLRRVMGYGDRFGATDCIAHVLGGGNEHALFMRFGLRPRFPVYRLRLSADNARQVGLELAKLLPGAELTDDVLTRRLGTGDLERLDRFTRIISRPMDHEYWINDRRLRLATVRDGQRVAAYAYGGPGQCGPVAANTKEAALAGLGWALQFAAGTSADDVVLMVPANFESALEHLQDANASCLAVSHVLSRQAGGAYERYILPSATLI